MVLAVSWAASVVSRDTPDIMSLAVASWLAVCSSPSTTSRMKALRELTAPATSRITLMSETSMVAVKSLFMMLSDTWWMRESVCMK